MYLIFVLECAEGYQDFFKESSYCFKVVNNTKKWEDAKNDCYRENGHLACFTNYTEIFMLSDMCEDCWLGYFWENGKIMTKDSSCIFL